MGMAMVRTVILENSRRCAGKAIIGAGLLKHAWQNYCDQESQNSGLGGRPCEGVPLCVSPAGSSWES